MIRIRLSIFILIIPVLGFVAGIGGRWALRKPPISYSTNFQQRYLQNAEYAVWLLGTGDMQSPAGFDELKFVVMIERTNAPAPSRDPRHQIDGLKSSYAHHRDTESGSTLLIDGKPIKPESGVVFLYLTDKAKCKQFIVDNSHRVQIQSEFSRRDPSSFITHWKPK